MRLLVFAGQPGWDFRKFDPVVAQCKAGDAEGCLTAEQVQTMRAIYGGVRDPKTGEQTFAGFPPGSELQLAVLISARLPGPPGAPGPQQPPMTRPLCPYPAVARYKGEGPIDKAESFACAAPPAAKG